MAAKTVWVTWLPDEASGLKPDAVLSRLGGAGLTVSGAPWVDDLKRMAWYELGTMLAEPGKAVDAWLIAGRGEDWARPSYRYALSLVTAIIREGRGFGFPIFGLGLDAPSDSGGLPTLLRGLRALSAKEASWPAKIATSFLKTAATEPWDFRLSAVGHPIIGQWFEIGPRSSEWAGAMFGVSSEATITHHLVGPKGQLPEKGVLEYPTQGIKAEVGGVEYTAWAVQNRITSNDSYYLKVEGHPTQTLIGGHPGTDQAEATVVALS